jgi:LacI family transcriptional regulator
MHGCACATWRHARGHGRKRPDRVALRVPHDLSIVGFDDVPMAGLARISLTTVAQPRDERARLGIAAIADRIEHKLMGPPRTTLVGVNLVTRLSTAPF